MAIEHEPNSHLDGQDGPDELAVVDSSLTRMMANFFIGVARPEVPVKVFSDADDGLEWLLDHEG